ncbi:NADH-ubiquinone oxidoreductase chain 49kDa [Thermoanaerobacter mathranii subsp. mathranii str. A3]|uniref:NADH-quinone oxidoreductase subunit D n=2 Tax=Thermoanaerobacter TaxID=1754 RepID=A0ABT9M6W4_9THEO|nr:MULTISPECIES: nickel-dependent hydrogenase large subunit [Thermoanaerobacter]ADH61311.1 NADH-ubiquinone oxidoreductase chain 49kDa [Thermoanaerobacter mathranii subsp. mathranii str. A3]MDP9751864.1 NADH-quinone oxidoreductase subunit D [Thermoanaerobacter pentosaceus]
MSDKSTIPFGPQHPVLPEPIHLKLVVEDEKVVEAYPSFGYVHRGLEMLAQKKDVNQMVYVVERVCGICSAMHGQAYCQGVESLLNIEVPERAKYLRVIWAELHRIHSHLLWLGLMADAFGFENLFMLTWRIREKIMDILEATSGNRVIISVNIIGGVRKDIDGEQAKWILKELDKIEEELKEVNKVVRNNYTIKQRTVGIGVLTKDDAYILGATGPVAKGSGVAIDMRMTGYAAYGDLDFEPVTETDGDTYARTIVRMREIFQSIDLVRQAINKMPEGEIAIKVKGNLPAGEVISRVEQSRGEVFYYLKSSGGKNLERLRIRTPTFANLAALLKMLPGSSLADVPVLVLTIDPCISCTER